MNLRTMTQLQETDALPLQLGPAVRLAKAAPAPKPPVSRLVGEHTVTVGADGRMSARLTAELLKQKSYAECPKSFRSSTFLATPAFNVEGTRTGRFSGAGEKPRDARNMEIVSLDDLLDGYVRIPPGFEFHPLNNGTNNGRVRRASFP